MFIEVIHSGDIHNTCRGLLHFFFYLPIKLFPKRTNWFRTIRKTRTCISVVAHKSSQSYDNQLHEWHIVCCCCTPLGNAILKPTDNKDVRRMICENRILIF